MPGVFPGNVAKSKGLHFTKINIFMGKEPCVIPPNSHVTRQSQGETEGRIWPPPRSGVRVNFLPTANIMASEPASIPCSTGWGHISTAGLFSLKTRLIKGKLYY